MAQVSVTIDGKAYRMACEEGQEDHLIDLAGRFDRYVGHLKSQFGEIGDLRLTVMAAIMIVDELTENERRLRQVTDEIAALRADRDNALESTEIASESIVSVIGEITGEIERLSTKLAGAPPAAREGEPV